MDQPYETAEPYLPDDRSLTALKRSAPECRGCPLWKRASQVVFGEGLVRSRLMLVGEMPGDREDREGRPFVGPAGRLLDHALDESGIDRDEAYVTNTVKHFKWEPRGKKRIHKTPDPREIDACVPWIEAEIDVIRPEIIVALGSTAAKTLLGSSFRVTKDRRKWVDSDLAPHVTGTVHPAWILRSRTDEERGYKREEFVDDFRWVAETLNGG